MITASISSVNLQPSDIDDTALAARKIIALAAPLDDTAGVDEAVGVGKRQLAADIAGCGPPPADTQRAIGDFQLHAVADGADMGGGKTGEAVVDVEGDAGLGRCVASWTSNPRQPSRGVFAGRDRPRLRRLSRQSAMDA
jgi:hypothetical protein